MTYMFWALFDGLSSWAKENKPNNDRVREREKREGLEPWRDRRLRSGEGIKIVEVKGECI